MRKELRELDEDELEIVTGGCSQNDGDDEECDEPFDDLPEDNDDGNFHEAAEDWFEDELEDNTGDDWEVEWNEDEDRYEAESDDGDYIDELDESALPNMA